MKTKRREPEARKLLKGIWKYSRQVAESTVDLLYPPKCPFCEEILTEQEKQDLVCGLCRGRLQYIGNDYCMKCGRPLLAEQEEYCRDCGKKQHFFTQGRSVFVYCTPVKQSLFRMKNSNRQEYARFYAEVMYQNFGRWIENSRIDVILPIPMYPAQKRIRGFNQAELLAVKLGKMTGITVARHLLVKGKDTHAQKSLDAKGRAENLKDAFEVKYRFDGERVLLVDDIYTTGATVDAAAKVLLQAGADGIYVITAAIGSFS